MADVPSTPLIDRLAFGVSAAGSPFVVLPLFLVLLAYHVAPTPHLAAEWSLLAVGGMVAVPLAYIGWSMRRGRITDLHVRLREQRREPFLAAIGGCLLAFVLLLAVRAHPAMTLAAGAAVANGLAFLAITLRWKISMHLSILAACAWMAGRLVAPMWLALFLALPPVMWARVRRTRHTWAQGCAAILLSLGITALCVETYLRLHGAQP